MFYTVLWDSHDVDGPVEAQENPNNYEVKSHDNLKDAVRYLIKNGARFDNQEVMQSVDWLPGDDNSQATLSNQIIPKVADDPGPPPGTNVGPVEQPSTLEPGKKTPDGTPLSPSQKLSALGFLPPQVRQAIINDD